MRATAVIFSLFAFLLCVAVQLPAADARGLYREGARAGAVGDFERAVEKYKEAIAANPAYLEPIIGLAEAFFFLEEYDEAFKYAARARSLDRDNSDLAVLEGRVRIGLGDIAGARAIFDAVLGEQPNNIEAQLGRAESDIADGKAQSALREYSRVVKLAPESSRALLSLATLSDALGDRSGAARYFELALKSHSSDPRVQLAAAEWYAETGDFSSAEKHVKVALSLAPDLVPARTLLGGVHLAQGRNADAIAVLLPFVGVRRDDPLAWYSLGLAYRSSGDPSKAMESFSTGLGVRPEDEIGRIALERTALDSLQIGDIQRKKASSYHIAQGRALAERNFLEKALAEFRRALLLDPTSGEARVAFARVYRSFGFHGKYLSELEVVAKLGSKDPFVLDEIEALRSERAETVSRLWGYDQYNLERRRYSIPVFTFPSGNRLVHPLASEELCRYFAFLLGRYDSVSVPEVKASVSGFEEAFRFARASATDYFIAIRADESERSFSAIADLYLSRTGTRIGSFSAFRTGNDRIRDSFQKISGQIAAILQPRGTLLVRRFDKGLIDLGSFQGLKSEDALVIVRNGGVRLDPEKPGLLYDEKDVVGDFRVTNPDEGVSEGTVTRKGYFDFVNPGDEVVSPARSAEKPQAAREQRSGSLLARIFRAGRP
jgi:tetratricopeptide (TPR) repeat protein